ncbi:uncharacterized protein LOC127769356 [Oryza glaberrima]|uniref:uncharacterized protein LOC127769356 n=1 Tax=Oryza glaberrima TaxID=4538 RepID=UPI00224C0A2D|nr:uncharacterized protein LOC127769356 [Oryza glaberrima]
MSNNASKGVAPMSGSEYSSSDSEATLDDIPPIVIDADLEEEENMSDMSSMLNLQGPDKLGNNQPLDIVPLNSIPFRQEVAFHQKVDSSKEEVPVPQWMKQLDNYKDGDWTVFLQIRDDGHKDWFYYHQKYKKQLRSRSDVKLFLKTTLINGTDMFKGQKLQKKRTMDSYGERSGGSKSNKGEKKNTSSKKSKKALSNGDYPVMPKKLTLPHGFV